MSFKLENSTNTKLIYRDFELPKIFVVGVGGGGCNTVTRLHRLGIDGAITIAINTDNTHLKGRTEANKKILIGKTITHGLGAGGYPPIGEQCALLSRNDIEEVLRGAELVFLLAGMGGGTGTGATPVIAEIAKKQSAVVIAIVSTPFDFEKRLKQRIAIGGIDKLRNIADSVIALDNNKLLEFVPTLPLNKGFQAMDDLIAQAVKGLTESITQPSLMNIDYADVKTIVYRSGLSLMLYGESDGDPDRVVENTLSHPFFDVNYKGATGALIHITSGTFLTVRDVNKIAAGITKELAIEANVKCGARIDESCGHKIKVMSILTGLPSCNHYYSRDDVALASGAAQPPEAPALPSSPFL